MVLPRASTGAFYLGLRDRRRRLKFSVQQVFWDFLSGIRFKAEFAGAERFKSYPAFEMPKDLPIIYFLEVLAELLSWNASKTIAVPFFPSLCAIPVGVIIGLRICIYSCLTIL